MVRVVALEIVRHTADVHHPARQLFGLGVAQHQDVRAGVGRHAALSFADGRQRLAKPRQTTGSRLLVDPKNVEVWRENLENSP